MIIQRFNTLVTLVLISTLFVGCATMCKKDGWTTLIDGTSGMDNFVQVGTANWTAKEGAIQADQGVTSAFLVTKESYKDFHLRVEFWSSDNANSGIFVRCQDTNKLTDENCYEVNIYDQRPDPTYGTGGIVRYAALKKPMIKAGGKWNTYEVIADGSHLVLKLNGVVTVDVEDSTLASGPIALQWGLGVIKFRKMEIRAL